MNEYVVIIGASGHGKVIADIIEKSGDHIVGFLDDDVSLGNLFIGYPLLGTIDEYKLYSDYKIFIAIGNADIRERIYQEMVDASWYTAIHPDAVIGKDVTIGQASVVMAGTVINPGTRIGTGVIVNTGATIDHDNEISDFVHVSVGVHLAGTVRVKAKTWIGAGAIISNNVSICGNCMIGAGAVVINDINESGTYVGVPAKRIRPVKNA